MEETAMKILKKYGTGLLAACVLLVLAGVSVRAAEETQFVSGTVWKAVMDVDVMEAADEKSDKVGTLKLGDTVFVAEDEKDGWCKVQNQSVEGYIPVSALQMLSAEKIEQMDQEFEAAEQFNSEIVNEYEYLQGRRRKTILWGCVIGALVIAIFAVGIVSAVRNAQREN